MAKSKSGGSVSRVEESMTLPDNSTQIDPFFADLKFELAGLPENTEQVRKHSYYNCGGVWWVGSIMPYSTIQGSSNFYSN